MVFLTCVNLCYPCIKNLGALNAARSHPEPTSLCCLYLYLTTYLFKFDK